MTVCIAALYGDGQGAVLASDKMVTAHIPMGYEFEHQSITKIVPMDGDPGSTFALAAGDVLLGTEILNIARVRIQQQLEQQSTITALEIAELVRSTYQQVRLTNIAQRELEPRGLDLETYYRNNQALTQQIVQIVDQALTQGDIGVEIIVTGPGNTSRYTIHTIGNPGILREHTPIGYSAIGSGAPHAMYSLIEASYESSLNKDKVHNIVSEAKKRSEVAPGVGSGTQMLVIPVEAE